jgi:hypothetical protein
MKKLLFISLMPFCAYAADYVISAYDDARDHDEVSKLVSSSIAEHKLMLSTDPFDLRVEGSFRTVLLRHQNQLAGVVNYFVKKDDSICFIDSLFVKPPHNTSATYLELVKTVLAYACEKKAGYVQTYESTKRRPLAEIKYQELIKIGFTECEQTEEEKKENAVLLQLHTSTVIPLFKLF